MIHSASVVFPSFSPAVEAVRRLSLHHGSAYQKNHILLAIYKLMFRISLRIAISPNLLVSLYQTKKGMI